MQTLIKEKTFTYYFKCDIILDVYEERNEKDNENYNNRCKRNACKRSN